MEIKRFILGYVQENCYLCIQDNHALLIDPGCESQHICDYIETHKLIVDAILITHGHFDHIGGVDSFATIYKCPVYISKWDEECLENSMYNLAKGLIVKSEVLHYQEHMKIGDFEFDIIEAPGHSPGSVFICIEKNIFTGDVLIKNEIGRLNFIRCDKQKMRETINLIKTLSYEYKIFPGHGELTTVENELKNNPYLIN